MTDPIADMLTRVRNAVQAIQQRGDWYRHLLETRDPFRFATVGDAPRPHPVKYGLPSSRRDGSIERKASPEIHLIADDYRRQKTDSLYRVTAERGAAREERCLTA